MNSDFRAKLLSPLLALLLACFVVPAMGADDEVSSSLGLSGEEPVITTSRAPRPTSKIAENITVITADDIARINAHTLADVLQIVPGIQLDYVRTPGSSAFFSIQGEYNTQIMVMIDGVPQQNFNQNQAVAGAIPVQQIERIEIIKGAASAAWGPALGGVVNIITKSPDAERLAGGMISGTMGERFTADSRGEVSGTVRRLGYYLFAGNLRSDGLLPNNNVNQNNLYAKFTYDLPSKGEATFGFSYHGDREGLDEGFVQRFGVVRHDDAKKRQTYGFLRFSQPIGDRLRLDLSGYTTSRDWHVLLGELGSTGVVVDNDFQVRESSRGAGAKVTWGDSEFNLVAGLEYEHAEAMTKDLLIAGPPLYDRTWDRFALYGNGAISFGPLTILPGLRIDHTGISGEYLSYTLGATLRLSDRTVLRAYGAQGYGLPNPHFQHGLQRVRTVQSGIETGEVPYLWLKGTYFYNNLSGIEYTNDGSLHNQIKQGFELEGRTVPIFGFSLASGYTFLDARDKDTGEQLRTNSGQSVPPHSVKLALNYDNDYLGLKGSATGNYVWWRAEGGIEARYTAMIWDLHLTQKLCPKNELSPELFFSVRNLFSGTQTLNGVLFTNTPRWVEGGMRFRF